MSPVHPQASAGRDAHDNRLRESIADLARSLPQAWRLVLDKPDVACELARAAACAEQAVADGSSVYPADPFKALRQLSPADTRVVILGQDPYHGPGQAQGMAFSVPDGMKRPPSLRNIFKELAREYPECPPIVGNDLTPWAEQGVLLLNTSLTVEDGRAGAHAKKGWEAVTDALIAHVAQAGPKVFMLWGTHAQAKQTLLAATAGHLVLSCNHPSPLSATRPPAPFLGCDHFRRANAWLVDNGRLPVNWFASTLVLDAHLCLPL